MKVLFAASEIAPFAATGGLAEIAQSLPHALCARGVEAYRVMPLYRHAMEGGFKLRDSGLKVRVPVGFSTLTADIWVCDDPPPTTYFIRRDEFFDRSQLYSLPDRDYEDNAERFVFFQKAVVALIDAMKLAPQIVHCSDWQTGLIPLFLRHGIHGMGTRKGGERTVFTIHNLAYQGIFPGSVFSITGLPFSCFAIDVMEFYGNINSMKAGIVTADAITTVSQSYALEIQTPEFGCALEGVLATHRDRLAGILNGVDYDEWNPATDTHLKRRYSADDLRGKADCKQDLIAEFHLDADAGTPVIGMVSRLTEQKGFDILAEAMPGLMSLGVSLVLLGAGSDQYQTLCRDWAKRWPGRFAFRLGYDIPLSHRIEGGADLYLMPSRFEPCGLNQMYSLRYGTIPIVHATGGLKDTIRDVTADPTGGNGFVFPDYAAASLLAASERAFALFRQRAAWQDLVRRAMAEDHSWSKAASAYLELYGRLAPQP